MKPKKAQAWGTDLTIAFVIFSFAIIFFYFYSFNYSNETEDILETMTYEGNFIADSILSPGYPTLWDESNVIEIGITTDGKINQTKLENFHELAQNNYEKTKQTFGTKYDYYFFMEDPLNSTLEGIGKPGTNSTNIAASNLMKITRFTIYQNKPTTAYVYIFK
ncbi:MAG: hypothetical protein V1889_01330 [archaeon]